MKRRAGLFRQNIPARLFFVLCPLIFAAAMVLYSNWWLYGVIWCYRNLEAVVFAKNVDKDKIMYLPLGITIC
ncbi:MAG: hypothetical protein VR69_12215 [Peptococcaceae bacterium BRH_c4b]|nr:MAG: hypothetical protein VR69_12215 [Peptococcaceae bacterium BRH_c4b]